MNLTWSNRVIKYILFVFNLLFVISGIIMIAVGVSVKSYYTDYDVFLNDSYFSLPNLLIATGSIIFFISFFGCCGAIRESWFMIFIFSILLSIIFILEFSAGIAGYVLREKTYQYLTDELLNSMDKYQINPEKNTTIQPITQAWDSIQSTFECCGAEKPEDWSNIINNKIATVTPVTTITVSTPPTNGTDGLNTTPTTSSTTSSDLPQNPLNRRRRRSVDLVKGDLPGSCCKSNPGATGNINCNLNNSTTASYYKVGCVDGFGNYLKDHAVTIGGVGLAIAFIQLFGVLFACYLTKQLKNGFYST